jgi:hypothetical protein
MLQCNKGAKLSTNLKTNIMRTIDKLVEFANQKPGLVFANYGDRYYYNKEVREIAKDLHDFRELLNLAFRRIDNLDEQLTMYLKNTSGRLLLNANNELEYCTGQYFCTEYRPACNRVLVDLIFASYRDEIEDNTPNPVYKDGIEIRKAIKKQVSRRVYSNYFN